MPSVTTEMINITNSLCGTLFFEEVNVQNHYIILEKRTYMKLVEIIIAASEASVVKPIRSIYNTTP